MTDASGRAAAPLPPVLQEAIERYTAWATQHLQNEEDATTKSITAPLYHYTDGHGLMGILKSGQMYFTDYRHLNDPSELTHGIDMAHDLARQLGNGADGRVRRFLEYFADLFRHEKFARKLEFFVASFSRDRDNLGQWRAYADNGRGFAIGFAQRMFRIVKPTPDQLGEFIGPVRYKIDAVRARHWAALEEAASIFLETANANPDLVRDRAVCIPFMDQFVQEIIAQPLIWNCLTSKHPAYKHEQEIRLIILGTLARLGPHITTRLRGRSEIVPYIEHPMQFREPHNIAEIVVGPAAPADAKRTVRTMLNSLGLDPNIEVSRSDIPYRAL